MDQQDYILKCIEFCLADGFGFKNLLYYAGSLNISVLEIYKKITWNDKNKLKFALKNLIKIDITIYKDFYDSYEPELKNSTLESYYRIKHNDFHADMNYEL